MGKKKKGNNKKKVLFRDIILENKKKLFVLEGEETLNLNDATERILNRISCVPLDGVVPVGSDEAVKKRTREVLSLTTKYAMPQFGIYEHALVYSDIPPTLMIVMEPSDVSDLFNGRPTNQAIESLLDRTNLNLILSMMTKCKKRLGNWLGTESDVSPDFYVINIPGIYLITGTAVKKNEVLKTARINLSILVVKTEKKLCKIKKKNEETFKEICQKINETIIKNAIAFGNSHLFLEMDPRFISSSEDYADSWIALAEDTTNKKALNTINLCTLDPILLTEVGNRIKKE